MTPEVARPENFVSIFALFWKNDPAQTSCCTDRDQNLPGPAPYMAHIVLDFNQIGSLSAELLPNA